MTATQRGPVLTVTDTRRREDTLSAGVTPAENLTTGAGPVTVAIYDAGRATRVSIALTSRDARIRAAHILNAADKADGEVPLVFMPPSPSAAYPPGHPSAGRS